MSVAFAGEPFLSVSLPNYESERFQVMVWLLLMVPLWLFLLPTCFATEICEAEDDGSTVVVKKSSKVVTIQKKEDSSPLKKSNNKRRKQFEGRNAKNQARCLQKDEETKETKREKTLFVPFYASIVGVSCFLISIAGIILLKNPHNHCLRRVLVAPMLSPSECQVILDMAETAARRNTESAMASMNNMTGETKDSTEALLQEPQGWQKTRHKRYPTTDLNLVTDPFVGDDRTTLKDFLDRRLAPLLSRIYGVPIPSIRANDMFVVRYDAKEASQRSFLQRHTDSDHISFNILLNDEFSGGGTRFWSRRTNEPFAHVQPRKGNVLLHSSAINHEGMPITGGTRVILVGFLHIDTVHPVVSGNVGAGTSTGLSYLGSWANLAWLHPTLKEIDLSSKSDADSSLTGWMQSSHVKAFLRDAILAVEKIGDWIGEHSVDVLVSDDNEAEYLQALDSAKLPLSVPASWYRGQQLSVSAAGSVRGEWSSREQNSQAFQEL